MYDNPHCKLLIRITLLGQHNTTCFKINMEQVYIYICVSHYTLLGSMYTEWTIFIHIYKETNKAWQECKKLINLQKTKLAIHKHTLWINMAIWKPSCLILWFLCNWHEKCLVVFHSSISTTAKSRFYICNIIWLYVDDHSLLHFMNKRVRAKHSCYFL